MESTLSLVVVNSLQRLDKCESLTISVRQHRYDRDTATAAMTRLMGSMARVKKLRLISACLDWNVSAIADALKTNVKLTTLKLELFECSSSPKELFAALEVNTTLKTLLIGFSRTDGSCAQALALAVSKNASLLNLVLFGHVADHCMISIAEGLQLNTTLEKLQFAGAAAGVDGVFALCDALYTNKTLKKLVFSDFSATQEERAALAKKLAGCNGYSRVLLPLAEPDLPCLSALLTCPTSSLKELGQLNVDLISDAGLKLLFDALASSSHVRTLKVAIDTRSQARRAALCSLLRANRSFRSITISLQNDQGQCVQELLDALEANRNISELVIDAFDLEMQTIESLSDFFARNRTIIKFKLPFLTPDTYRIVENLSRGMMMNPLIVEFETCLFSTDDRATYFISQMLRRNRSVLNRAVDFVVLHCNDKRAAEAFELFRGKPCLLDKVTETSGKTESEAQFAIASARNCLLDNYLVITGIVRRSVMCHPRGSGTECDQLNADCWQAIVRHLKVSDVLS
ncbi:hypothetical protein V5799_034012 [Amblyomma americanum]|uniref:Ran gtpase-activating protein n=1 Tax=Amblyomma americanum TaxID=6943 RepID=A0AAQ4DLP4_AMBAM